jgi:hypothetical protein
MFKIILSVVSLAFLASPAFAVIDVSDATTSITTDGTAAITAVGGALIGLAGVAVVFKWVKGAIFG